MDPQIHVRDAEVLGSNPGSPTTKVQVSGGFGPRWFATGVSAHCGHPDFRSVNSAEHWWPGSATQLTPRSPARNTPVTKLT